MCRHDAGKALKADGGIVGPDADNYHRGAPRLSWKREGQGILAMDVSRPSVVKLRYYVRQPGVFVRLGIDSRHGRQRSAPLMLLNTSRQT
jgi:hypothetical protein